MSRLGIITGMKIEAEILHAAARNRPGPARPMITVTGGDPGKAEIAAREFAAAGAAGLVSFGVAGGLDPSLLPGVLILADGVLLPNGEAIPTRASWRAALAATDAVDGMICGSDLAVSGTNEKACLFKSYGARAVDMESHGVARAARDTGLPFLIIRAVADPANRAIPPAALAGLGADGEQKPVAVLRALLKSPTQLPAVIRLARDAKRALRRLAAVAPAVIDSEPV